MGKKSGPAPPNYQALAEQQAAAQNDLTTQNTWANRADQSNPWGQQSWNATQAIDPVTGKPVTQWSQQTTLDPTLQRALDAQFAGIAGRSELSNQMLQGMQGQLGQPVDTSNFMGWGAAPQAGNLQAITDPYSFGGSRQRAEDAIYKSATSRLDPQWQQRQGDLESQLANRGITRNSAAFEREMKNLNMGRNDAYSQAQMNAITGGGAEAQRDLSMRLGTEQQAFGQQQAALNQNFNQQLYQSQYANETRDQQLREALGLRGNSIDEMNALMQGYQVGMPQFGSYNAANAGQAANVLGAQKEQFDAALGQHAQKQANQTNTMSAVGGIAMGAIML